MLDWLRPIFFYGMIAIVVGSLWQYARIKAQTDLADRGYYPAPRPIVIGTRVAGRGSAPSARLDIRE
ncbi:MAG: hypothetical protein ACREIT_10340 [Tepidisphaeraceae bacterium]